MQVLILRINILPSGRESKDLQRVSEFIHHHFTRIIELRNAETVAQERRVVKRSNRDTRPLRWPSLLKITHSVTEE